LHRGHASHPTRTVISQAAGQFSSNCALSHQQLPASDNARLLAVGRGCGSHPACGFRSASNDSTSDSTFARWRSIRPRALKGTFTFHPAILRSLLDPGTSAENDSGPPGENLLFPPGIARSVETSFWITFKRLQHLWASWRPAGWTAQSFCGAQANARAVRPRRALSEPRTRRRRCPSPSTPNCEMDSPGCQDLRFPERPNVPASPVSGFDSPRGLGPCQGSVSFGNAWWAEITQRIGPMSRCVSLKPRPGQTRRGELIPDCS